MIASPPAGPNKEAIAAVVEVLKLETSLATGVLAFSIGLVTATSVIYVSELKPWLIVGWLILAISVIAGVWGLSYAALLYTDPKYNIDSSEVRITTGITQAGFVVGSFAVAVVLVVSLIKGPAHDEGIVRSPIAALRIAETAPGVIGHRIVKVETIELIRGTEPARLSSAAWHVKVEIAMSAGNSRTKAVTRTVDVYIDPVTAGVPPHIATSTVK